MVVQTAAGHKRMTFRQVLRHAAVLLLFSGIVVSCASAPGTAGQRVSDERRILSGSNDKGDSVTQSAIGSDTGTPLAVPSRDQLGRTSPDAAITALLETGSPESLRTAISRINQDPRGMIDSNRISLAVALELMKIVYPLEPLSVQIPPVPETDPHIGAIRSARLGIYDYNTGNRDFLSLLLPSLVLFTVSDSNAAWLSDSLAAVTEARKRNGTSVLPPLFLAEIARRQGQSSVSANHYRDAWNLDQSCYPAGVGLVRALIASREGKQAVLVANDLLARYPESLMMLKLKAEAAYSASDWAQADPVILQVLKAEPDNAAFLLMRAHILVERKDYLRANALLDAFATINRTDKTFLLLRSRVIREWNKNMVSAISVLQEAHQRYPADIDVLLSAAEVSYQSGQRINGLSGRDFVLRVVDADRTNRRALYLLSVDYIRNSEWNAALRAVDTLVSIDPAAENRTLRVQALLGAGRNSDALPLAQSLYRESPGDLVISLYLDCLIAVGNTQLARQIISERLPLAGSSLKSVLYYQESRIVADGEASLSSLRSSLLADPRNLSSLFAMYEWYFNRKDFRKAQYYLKQVIALEPGVQRYTILLSNLDELLAR